MVRLPQWVGERLDRGEIAEAGDFFHSTVVVPRAYLVRWTDEVLERIVRR